MINSPNGLNIYYSGPPLKEGSFPALFYFALSGSDSLSLAPYNQPAVDLLPFPIRVFSFSLPYHGEGYENKKAMEYWIQALHTQPHFLEEFLIKALENIHFLIEQGIVDPNKIATAGLSRGGLIATHLAARDSRIQTILGYAPLTSIEHLSEFEFLKKLPEIQIFDLHSILDSLIGKHLRFYIGNRDQRVNTDACYHFIRHLTDRSFERGLRQAHVELIMTSSTGYKGHGTLPHIFKEGTDWIKKQFQI